MTPNNRDIADVAVVKSKCKRASKALMLFSSRRLSVLDAAHQQKQRNAHSTFVGFSAVEVFFFRACFL